MYVHETDRPSPFTITTTGGLPQWLIAAPCLCDAVPSPGELGGYCPDCDREWTVVEDTGGRRRQTLVGCFRVSSSTGPDGDDRTHEPHGPPYLPPDARGGA